MYVIISADSKIELKSSILKPSDSCPLPSFLSLPGVCSKVEKEKRGWEWGMRIMGSDSANSI